MVATGTRPAARLARMAAAAARRGLGPGRWEAVALAVLLMAVPAASGQGQSGRRLALVVGNDAYTELSVLRNAVNDARTVAVALEEVGFTVTRVENTTRSRLAAALGRFAARLRGDDVALFYFAGHGVQVDNTNYLIPTDYAGQTAAEVRLSAFSAAEVEDLLRPARVAMLVFDACRNNPYRGIRTSGGGLAAMEARGTLIAFAAGAGEVAADAAGPGSSNGLFTSKLVEALRVPGLTATALFQRVRREVYASSNEEQFPAVYDQLLSDFVFRPALTAGGATGGAAAAPGSAAAALRQETVFWESIRASADPADFEAYLELFADGTFSRLARNRLAELRRPGSVSRPTADPSRRRRPGDVFRDCAECPEMVVLSGGGLAMGRYEVTMGEYRAFVSATGGTGNDMWRYAWSPLTDRHPVGNVSWDDAQAYVSWLSRRTGATYRLPSEAEWERAAAGSRPGCDTLGRGSRPDGPCPVGTNGANAAGLSDMRGNVGEWTSDCAPDGCGRRVLRGFSWLSSAEVLRLGRPSWEPTARRLLFNGFRVSRTLD